MLERKGRLTKAVASAFGLDVVPFHGSLNALQGSVTRVKPARTAKPDTTMLYVV